MAENRSNPMMGSEVVSGDKNNNLSRSVWNELLGHLKQAEAEEDVTFTFDPFPSVREEQRFEAHDAVPHGIVVSEHVDSEEALKQFLGKSLDLHRIDFSDRLVKARPARELVHGQRQELIRSFCERLKRLRSEVPEVLAALNSFGKSGYSTLQHDGKPIKIQNLIDSNVSMVEMKNQAEQKLDDLMKQSKEFQMSVHGSESCGVYLLDGIRPMDSSRVSIQPLLNLLMRDEQSREEYLKTGSSEDLAKNSNQMITTSFDLEAMRRLERAEVAEIVHNLERRIELLNIQARSENGASILFGEKDTLKNTVERMLMMSQLLEVKDTNDSTVDYDEINETSLLEAQLNVLEANLQLLEGVPPTPDVQDLKSSRLRKLLAQINIWDPNKVIKELSTLAEANKSSLEKVKPLRRALIDRSTEQREAEETMKHLKFVEILQSDTKSMLGANNESIAQLRDVVKNHGEQLRDIQQSLKQKGGTKN